VDIEEKQENQPLTLINSGHLLPSSEFEIEDLHDLSQVRG